MSWRYLDRVNGIAIDNENTLAHHQLVSLDRDSNTLQYTVFYEPLNKKEKPKVSKDYQEEFSHEMNVKTEGNYSQREKLTASYKEFFEAIRPHGVSIGFQEKKLAKALTFDISFNQDYHMIGMSYRPTLGYMIKKMTYRDAERQMQSSNDLQVLYDIAYQSLTHKQRAKKEPMRYETVVQRIGDFVREQKLHIDLFDNMDCIFRNDELLKISPKEQARINKMQIDEWADTFARYHGVLHYLNNSNGSKSVPKKSVVPTTASRSEIDHYNIMMTGETLVSGQSPFMEDVTLAVANFKKHQNAWKQFGLM